MESETGFVLDAVATTTHTNYQTTVISGNHTITTDEPGDIGGGDTGMSPYNLLLASLASCTAITLRMYIDRKMWVVDEIKVTLEMYSKAEGILIESKLSFKGELSQHQLKRLVTIADACPIHKILVGNIAINTSIR